MRKISSVMQALVACVLVCMTAPVNAIQTGVQFNTNPSISINIPQTTDLLGGVISYDPLTPAPGTIFVGSGVSSSFYNFALPGSGNQVFTWSAGGSFSADIEVTDPLDFIADVNYPSISPIGGIFLRTAYTLNISSPTDIQWKSLFFYAEAGAGLTVAVGPDSNSTVGFNVPSLVGGYQRLDLDTITSLPGNHGQLISIVPDDQTLPGSTTGIVLIGITYEPYVEPPPVLPQVPEPSSFALMLLGALAVFLYARRVRT